MPRKNEPIKPAIPHGTGDSCCSVEALVAVDERGQMVLPKELREKVGIKAGDKLAVTSWEKDGTVGCITLIKAGSLEPLLKGILGPVLDDLFGK